MTGQDWAGMLTVYAIVPVAVTLSYGWARLDIWLDAREDRALRTRVAQMITAGAAAPGGPEVDHVDCGNPDCDQTICACRTPGECAGCSTAGCYHDWPWLCWDCRPVCRDCSFEDETEMSLRIVRESGAA